MRGIIINIEGTDCSGKQTQSMILVDKLREKGYKAEYFSFPKYDTPTGKIIGGPYLGKPHIGGSWFLEKAPNVDPLVSALYFTADRIYNLPKIETLLNQGINVVLDRYSFSNMAHQAGKIKEEEKRFEMYNNLDFLEFKFSKLPIPEIKVLLYMPYIASKKLRENRSELLDDLEKNEEHLKLAEKAYLEIAKKYDFKIIDCSSNDNPRKIEDISEELFSTIIKKIENINL